MKKMAQQYTTVEEGREAAMDEKRVVLLLHVFVLYTKAIMRTGVNLAAYGKTQVTTLLAYTLPLHSWPLVVSTVT
jgi:hypothetical protein